MNEYPFAHSGPAYMVYDHDFEIVYYSKLGKKYRRVRNITTQEWDDTTEQEVDNETFWMVIACIERIR